MTRLCQCNDCSFYRTRDPVTGSELIGQYLGDGEFKEHRRRDLAHVRGASHLEQLTINPPLLGLSLNANPEVQTATSDLITSVLERQETRSPRFQAELFHARQPTPSSPPVSTGDLLMQRLNIVQSKLSETNIQRTIASVKIVFAVPPSTASPPMTRPLVEQLALAETVPTNRPIIEHERWLDSAEDLTGVLLGGDYEAGCRDYAAVLLDRVQQEKEALLHVKMKEWEKVRRTTLGLPPKVRRVDTVSNVSRPFRNALPQLLLTYLIIASLYLIAGVSLDLCNFFLIALRKLVALSPTDSLWHRPLYLDIPRDVETAIARVSSPPKTKAFVCCPHCFALYTYDPETFGTLPEVCSSKRTKASSICGTLLSSRSRSSSSTQKPTRLFLYHELEDWIAYLYSRSDLEGSIDRDIFEADHSHSDHISDILESPGVRQFLGPEGDPNRPFLKRPGNEGRIIFSLNMDGFNPLMNKEGGKKISVGAMYLVCLSLPPAIRYNLENIFLVGIIPGPQEPSKDEINFVLEPLVDDLIQIWQHGFYLTSTPHHPHGRLVRGALIPLICDLPAARQMSGFAGFQSTHFCSYCTLKSIDMDNFDHRTWPRRTEAEHRRLAEEWRRAISPANQEAIFDKSGIRWSQLLRLPYWDPTKFVMIDSMHGFFLRMFQRHCRQIWGMGVDIEDGDYPSFAQDKARPSDAEMEEGYRILRCESDGRLQGLKRSILQELARLSGSVPYGGRAKKIAKDLIEYRTRRGWFDAEGQAIPQAEAPSAHEFLQIQPKTNNNQAMDRTRQRGRHDAPTEEELDQGLLSVMTGTKSEVKRLYKSVLLEVCRRLGIQFDSNAVKKDILNLLEGWRRKEGIIDITGQLVEKRPAAKQQKRSKKSVGVLGRETLAEIRRDMEGTSLPTWMSPAPKRPGEAKSGKFTADEWRSFCLVNLPITLNRLWGQEPVDSRKRQMLDNFMHLVSAVKLATMRHMNERRITAYEYHIHKYLTSLLTLYPGTAISPYQHLALHFPEFLRRFGPVHAWRCFPFERYNYLLQNIPTNMKLGEMESTLLTRFCKGQKLRSLINPVANYLPPELDDLLSEWQGVLDTDIRGTRVGDTFAHDEFFHLDTALNDLAVGTTTRLPPQWLDLLLGYFSLARHGGPSSVNPFVYLKRRVKRLGQVFQTEEASNCNSHVYFKDAVGSLEAGIIQGIFLYENFEERTLFFIIKPFKPLPQYFEENDPYRRFPDASGKLYQSTTTKEIIVTESNVLYHFAKFPTTLLQIPIPCIVALPLDRS